MASTQSPVDLPSRQSTLASNLSDDAVPDTDPNSVSFLVFSFSESCVVLLAHIVEERKKGQLICRHDGARNTNHTCLCAYEF